MIRATDGTLGLGAFFPRSQVFHEIGLGHALGEMEFPDGIEISPGHVIHDQWHAEVEGVIQGDAVEFSRVEVQHYAAGGHSEIDSWP